MAILSYNEEQQHETELRHFFLPNAYGLISETVIAVVALLLFNLSAISGQLIATSAGITTSPFSILGHIFDTFLADGRWGAAVQEVMLFMLWAIVGALVYILLFRLIQLFIRARGSVRQGVALIHAEHSRGALRWFASLHDFFLKLLIVVAGGVALLTGALVCFGIASQELHNGLVSSFPNNVGLFLISFIGAFIAVRVIVVGVSLLSPRFRAWYNS